MIWFMRKKQRQKNPATKLHQMVVTNRILIQLVSGRSISPFFIIFGFMVFSSGFLSFSEDALGFLLGLTGICQNRICSTLILRDSHPHIFIFERSVFRFSKICRNMHFYRSGTLLYTPPQVILIKLILYSIVYYLML